MNTNWRLSWPRRPDGSFVAAGEPGGPTHTDAFLRYVAKGDGCWQWSGVHNSSGYGRYRFHGRFEMAHRVAFKIFVGPIPAGKVVCHRCDNPSCVNPKHLFVGSQSENIRDCVRKGRYHSKRGSCHPLARLTETAVAKMRRLHKSGSKSLRELSEESGVAYQTVVAAVRGQNWSHV